MDPKDNIDVMQYGENSKSAERKNCPQCGFELYSTAKYCSECGYDFNTNSVNAKENASGKKKLLRKLIATPYIMFGVFALLLFAFFATPVLRLGGFGFNVYALCGDVNDTLITALMILLVVSAVIILIIALLMGYYRLTCTVDERIGAIIESKVSEILPIVVYLFYVVVGIIMIVVVAVDNAVAIDACPVLLTVFSSAFTCVSAGITLCKKKLQNGEYMTVIANSVKNAKIIGGYSSGATVKPDGESNSYVVPKKKKSNREYVPQILFLFLTVMTVIAGAAFSAIKWSYDYYYGNYSSMFEFNFEAGNFVEICLFYCQILFAAVCLSALIVGIIAFVQTAKKKDGAKLARRALLAFGIVFLALMIIVMIIVMTDTRFYAIEGVYIILVLACIYIIAAIIIMKWNRKSRNGKKNRP